ncbi:PaaX family transcriptional regulator C-terminal domain-containing protein, partial [Streptomyces sp. NPDC059556]|uniref:PaaX family transcriptional regulator n=1 Tax=Streptomyces sp. NPDC059556 TaxID=3346863 RepID=UPI003681553A
MAEQHTPRSLIVSLYGAYGRSPDGSPMPVAALIRLLAVLGVDAPSVRSSVSRLKRRGLLLPGRTADGAAGYALSDDARRLLDDGDRRIYARTEPKLSEGWVLAVFSVPEAERHKRHLLRSRLARLGFGTAAPGVWIAPARLYEETRNALERLELSPYVDLFRGDHLGYAATAGAVARWWDLPAIARLHEDFLAAHEPVLRAWRAAPTGAGAPGDAVAPGAAVGPGSAIAPAGAEAAYRDYLLALDSWRRLPYADPVLPGARPPPHWPGRRAGPGGEAPHPRGGGPAPPHPRVRRPRGRSEA